MTETIPQYCYYFVITLIFTSLAVAQHNPNDLGNEEDVVKRASAHSHNIMRFGRGGHNIMHFGKRAPEEVAREDSGVDTGDASNELDTSYANSDQMDANSYDPKPFSVGQRSVRTRYFIPHAFIASLYTHPRPFLKKAAESRDNVFMHFG